MREYDNEDESQEVIFSLCLVSRLTKNGFSKSRPGDALMKQNFKKSCPQHAPFNDTLKGNIFLLRHSLT